MKVIPFDLETTANGPDNSPEAHYRANEVVLAGWLDGDDFMCGSIEDFKKFLVEEFDDVLLVAHNLKFDIKYLLRDTPQIFDAVNDKYYCTMGAEYLLSGHKDKFIKLEELADKYGIEYTKSLDLGEYIKAGGKVEDIPYAELKTYLEGDVRTTKHIYDVQQASIINHSRAELLTDQGDFIKNLAQMELAGLCIDREYFKRELITSETRMQHIEDTIERITYGFLSVHEHPKLNTLAPRTISAVLTGFPSKISFPQKSVPDINIRQGVLDDEVIKEVWGEDYEPNPKTGYTTSEKVIRELYNKTGFEYLELLLEYRKLNKLVNTYYGPFLEQTTDEYPFIHPTLNYTATNTGRLSSSNPNGQNLPNEVRKGIVSRYTGGRIIEVDFKQLEVVVLAYVTGDKQLLRDLEDGRDVHYEVGKSVMGWRSVGDMDKASRRTVKGVVFGLIYGGGVTTLAEQGGTDKSTAQKIIDAFYKRYPMVEVWQRNFYKSVLSNAKPMGFKGGHQVYESLTGLEDKTPRVWTFVQTKSPDWLFRKTGERYSFTPTQTKNWPIQGIAGGDIVPYYINEISRLCSPNEMILTVHDSVLFDIEDDDSIHDSDFNLCARKVVDKMELPCSLVVEIDRGPTWK